MRFSGDLPQHHFTVPKNNSGRGNVLKVGRGVSIYWDLQPANRWPRHHHSTCQIVIALDPVEARMSWGTTGRLQRQTTTNAHVWCVPAGTPHSAAWSGTAAMLVIYVEPEFIREECGEELSEGMVLSLGPLIQQDYLMARFCRHYRELCHGHRGMSEPMLFAGAIMVSAAVIRHCLGRLNGDGTLRLREAQIEIISAYLETHIRDTITVAKLAKAVGMSVDHFARLFRDAIGRPPMKYVWRFRIHRARQLLETGQFKVAQVAVETGFYDQSHLDRQFRRAFGISPGSVIPKNRKV